MMFLFKSLSNFKNWVVFLPLSYENLLFIFSFMECTFGVTELLSGLWPHPAFSVTKGGHMTEFWSMECEQGTVLKVSCCASSAPSSSLSCVVSGSGVMIAGAPSWPSRLRPGCGGVAAQRGQTWRTGGLWRAKSSGQPWIVHFGSRGRE